MECCLGKGRGECLDVRWESGLLYVGLWQWGPDPGSPSLKMWTNVRQRCVQERTSSARTWREAIVVSVPRATNRSRASV